MPISRFNELRSTIEEQKSVIQSRKGQAPYLIPEGFLKRVRVSFLLCLDALDEICNAADGLGLVKYDDDLKMTIWESMHGITEVCEAVHSEKIPAELFFFLKDIANDLKMDRPLAMRLGSSFRARRVDRHFFELGTMGMLKTKKYLRIGEDLREEDARIIEYPGSEIEDPLGFALIVHECFHLQNVARTLVEELSRTMTGIPEDKREEIIVDILSVNYIGPVFAQMISKMPEKIGKHEGYEHPSLRIRLSYLKDYLTHIEKKAQSPPIELSKGTNGLFNAINSHVREEIENNRVMKSDLPSEDREILKNVRELFPELQRRIEQFFNENEVPSYITQMSGMETYLGFEKGRVDNLVPRIQEWFDRNISLAIKPCLMLNLALLFDGSRSVGSLLDLSLISFKKWLVRGQYERGQEEMKDQKKPT